MVETLQRTALGLIILWPSLATVVVALIVYTRISMKRFSLGKIFATMDTWTYCLTTAPTDDYTIVIAWSLAVGQAVISSVSRVGKDTTTTTYRRYQSKIE
jgi:hypothetical protein